VALSASQETKERIRQAIDIVELIGGYLQIAARRAKLQSPVSLADDSRPSLHVNPEGNRSNAGLRHRRRHFSFMMKMENVEFPEALAMVAQRRWHPAQAQHKPPAACGQRRSKTALYQRRLGQKNDFINCLLNAPEADRPGAIWPSGKITPESIQKISPGFCPDRWDWLINQAMNSEISRQNIGGRGIDRSQTRGPGHYDRFRGRVVFPIRDVQGRPRRMGGRILPTAAPSGQSHNAGQYSSPEPRCFPKRRMLYAWIRPAKLSAALAIGGDGRLHRHHYRPTVWLRSHRGRGLGTALAAPHSFVKRFAIRITLVLDGDEAGQRRANEILGLFVAD